MHVNDDGTAIGSIDRAALEALEGEAAETVEVAEEVEAEAVEEDVEASDDEEQADLDELRAEAESLGIKVDGRWGEQRLRDEILGYKEG